ncbi:MAG: PAS domain S-box protein, partial [Acidobacteriota bacterium]|nr:PAS domain S-box protein [Acidobacteriota bacterium]
MSDPRGPANNGTDLSLLYELSLAVGESLDSRKACDSFLKILMARRPLDIASVWVRPTHLVGRNEDDGYALLFCTPAYRIREVHLETDHPIVDALGAESSVSCGSEEARFADLVTESGIDGGRFAIFRLGDLGFMKLHSTVAQTAVSETRLSQLRPVVAKFAVALDGALAHERLVWEIHERERAERALQESERRYRHLYDDNPSMYFTIDRAGVVASVNAFGAAQLGYVPSELIGRSVLEVFLEEDRAEVGENLAKALENPDEVFQWSSRKVRRDGTVIWVEEFARAIEGKVLIVCQDVSKHRKLEAQVQHAQRIESLGVLAGGIAHDFNNLLTGMLGNAELARIETAGSSAASRHIGAIETAALRAADLCKQLLAYSGEGKFVIERVGLNSIALEMSDLFAALTRKTPIRYGLSDREPWMDGDPTQIAQVVMNLVTNAAEAIEEEGGTIGIDSGIRHCDETLLMDTYLGKGLAPGDYSWLRISDTGCGMDEETLDRMFDPFFTTKFTGRGLGLAAVLGIVRGHEGTLAIESAPGRGTSVTVFFPSADAPARGATESPPDVEAWRGEGTVLLIDDEVAARDVAEQMLRRVG